MYLWLYNGCDGQVSTDVLQYLILPDKHLHFFFVSIRWSHDSIVYTQTSFNYAK